MSINETFVLKFTTSSVNMTGLWPCATKDLNLLCIHSLI